MTDRQASALQATIIGAAFFIGGAILFLAGVNLAVLFMVVGIVLLIKDFVVSLWTTYDMDNQVIEKEEREK